jgi:hypothetical protein
MDSEAAAYDEEHLEDHHLSSLIGSGAKCNSQTWRFGIWEKKVQDSGWRAIACTLSILPRSRHLLQRILGGTLGWTGNCSWKIVFDVREFDYYFLLKKDCARICCFTTIKKCVNAMLLAYGALGDTTEDSSAWPSPWPSKPCTSYVGWWWRQCLDQPIRERQMNQTCSDSCTKLGERFSWELRKHRLHALRMEELSICSARVIFLKLWQIMNVDLARVLWDGKIKQWHQCVASLSVFSRHVEDHARE